MNATDDAFELLAALPGEALIRKGLADRSADVESVESCLVQIAAPRLGRAGLLNSGPSVNEPERTLYRLLLQSEANAYARYNALLRELISFEHALDHRMSRTMIS